MSTDTAGQLIQNLYNDTQHPINRAFGNLTQIGNSARPARSNAYFMGGVDGLSDGALAATGIGCFVPVPVQVGDVITAISIQVGATAGGTMTHQFAALYSGIATPALLAQSTDTTSAAIGASAIATWTLANPVTITAAMAPNGFVYAEVAITASTVPTAAAFSTPTAVGYQIAGVSTSPLFQSATAGSALAGTAAATCASPAAKAVAPLVILT